MNKDPEQNNDNSLSNGSDFLKDFMESEALDVSQNEINLTDISKPAISIELINSDTKKVSEVDKKTQDLLRRMVMQEIITEEIHPEANDVDFSHEDEQIEETKEEKKQVDYSLLKLFGLQVSTSNKEDVIKTMKEKSSITIEDITLNKFVYDDIGIVFHFNKNAFIDSITIIFPSKEATVKGLKIDDNMDKAIELYGHPSMRTTSAARWKNLSVFLNDNVITSLRLKAY